MVRCRLQVIQCYKDKTIMALEWCTGILMFRNHVLLTCLAPRAIIVPNTPDNPLQSSCLENPMDGRASQATVHGVAKSRTWLSDFSFFLSFFCIVINYKYWLIWVKLILIIPPQILLNCFLHCGLFLRNKNQFFHAVS